MLARNIDQELDQALQAGPAGTITIPPCPDLLTRLQTVMRESDPDWDVVASIAASDVAMAASLVRAANSPLYSRRSSAASVPQAMAVLGLRQTSALLMQFLTLRALPVNHPALQNFWQGSSRRAMAMGYIARQLYGMPPDLAHTFGLFCDVGIPVLLQGLRGYAGTLAEAQARRDRSFTATEQANHRTDHCIVGALVARAWRLPAELKVAIRLHHEPEALADTGIAAPVRALIAAGVIADHLVARHEGLPESSEWRERGAACLAHLQVREDELTLWLDDLQPALGHLH
ncbi:MAG: HDOD domain-containing protein [Burkholderiaceae bacterium]|nr:HDOD domain-containing protein [Burkholderiaceae bacterium]